MNHLWYHTFLFIYERGGRNVIKAQKQSSFALWKEKEKKKEWFNCLWKKNEGELLCVHRSPTAQDLQPFQGLKFTVMAFQTNEILSEVGKTPYWRSPNFLMWTIRNRHFKIKVTPESLSCSHSSFGTLRWSWYLTFIDF